MDRTDAGLSAKCLPAILITSMILTGSAFAGTRYSVVFRFLDARHGHRPYELIADHAGYPALIREIRSQFVEFYLCGLPGSVVLAGLGVGTPPAGCGWLVMALSGFSRC
jgi:hypothetical protein